MYPYIRSNIETTVQRNPHHAPFSDESIRKTETDVFTKTQEKKIMTLFSQNLSIFYLKVHEPLF